MLSDDEREVLRELERQFSVGPVVVDEPHGCRQRSRFVKHPRFVDFHDLHRGPTGRGFRGRRTATRDCRGPRVAGPDETSSVVRPSVQSSTHSGSHRASTKRCDNNASDHIAEKAHDRAGSSVRWSTCTVTHSIDLLGPGAVRSPPFDRGAEATPAGRLRGSASAI